MIRNNLGNKETMAVNIRRHMEARGLNAHSFSQELGFKYTTVRDWLNARSYPRIDKIEMMANYFGIEKSDLVEEYDPTLKAITPLSHDFAENYNKYIDEFVDMFNSLTKKQQIKLYKEIAKSLRKEGLSTIHLKKPSDIIANLTAKQKELNRLAEIKRVQIEEIHQLEEESRIAEIALEILSISDDDIEAQKIVREKYSEEDFNKAVDYIEKLEKN